MQTTPVSAARGLLSMTGAAMLAAVMAAPASATDTPVLTIIWPATMGAPTEFAFAELQAMPPTEVVTNTPWTEGVQHFTGVALDTVLDGLRGAYTLQLTAVNDYSVTMPLAEVGPDFPVVAYARNGAPMSVRDKGPLWLVYPFDASPDFRNETVFSRSIWQLVRIDITE